MKKTALFALATIFLPYGICSERQHKEGYGKGAGNSFGENGYLCCHSLVRS
jgi:hypothetical protein